MLNIIYNRYIIVLADVIFLNFNRLGLTSPLLRNYIHQSGCIRICKDNRRSTFVACLHMISVDTIDQLLLETIHISN